MSFAPKAQATIRAAGAKFVLIGGAGGASAKAIEALDGTPPKRVTVQQWDSLDAVKAWYNSKDYVRPSALAVFRNLPDDLAVRTHAIGIIQEL
jgi:uncharacterized protein (DUF1330 family)